MESKQKFRADPKLKLMDQVRQVVRYHHYAYQTEKTYCDWIVRHIRFHGANKHSKTMGKGEIEAFLSHLAVNRNVSAATQRQALNAIVFLYRRGQGRDTETCRDTYIPSQFCNTPFGKRRQYSGGTGTHGAS
jgi:hypothetical protein